MKKLFLILLLPILLLAQKPKLLLLKTYDDQNVTGWVMSEKFDGIRAYWSGEKLISRGGKVIHAPEWFLANFPPFEIDGELWTKGGDFENISSIVREKIPSDDWSGVTYNIFEVPNSEGNLYERLAKVKPYESKIIKIVSQVKLRDKKHLQKFLTDIENKGGEGVVVRDPNAPYINKRTSKALKLKSFKDSECEVTGYTKGRGKIKGLIGALVCRLPNGTEFKVGSGLKLKDREHPPKIGADITFKYQEFTKYGKPRFPVYLRVKSD